MIEQTWLATLKQAGALYIAYFLGTDGAARPIGAAASQRRAYATAMFPAFHGIFFMPSGDLRSASAVYAKLTGH